MLHYPTIFICIQVYCFVPFLLPDDCWDSGFVTVQA